MSSAIPAEIRMILKEVAKRTRVQDFTLEYHGQNRKGEGYSGNIFFVALEDKIINRKMNLVVKQAHTDKAIRSILPVENSYRNESTFFDVIWPNFVKFQKERLNGLVFDKIPKCYITSCVPGAEKLVLENLKHENFETYNKRELFDQAHLEFILKEYGKFHALSFAFKNNYPDKYLTMSQRLRDVFNEFSQACLFKEALKSIHQQCVHYFTPGENDKIIQKLKQYGKNAPEIFLRANKYQGNYPVIVHGDCWSNNMMFKYDESRKLINMRFIDFQAIKSGTPVYDLSYFIYSGASNAAFDELDQYLKIYHQSLSTTLKAFDCVPEMLYPMEALKNEWRIYSKFGFIMALILLKGKLAYDQEALDMNDLVNKAQEDVPNRKIYDETTLKKRAKEIILHMHNRDFL